MNDLKTAERNSLGQRNLNNLMVWHTSAKHLTCAEVPVLAILKEFRGRLEVPKGTTLIGRLLFRHPCTNEICFWFPVFRCERESAVCLNTESACLSCALCIVSYELGTGSQ
mgnify:CR=1 FL=1